MSDGAAPPAAEPAAAAPPPPAGAPVRVEETGGSAGDFRSPAQARRNLLAHTPADAVLAQNVPDAVLRDALRAEALDGAPAVRLDGIRLVPAQHRLVALAAALNLAPGARLLTSRGGGSGQLDQGCGTRWEARLADMDTSGPLIIGRMTDSADALRESVCSLREAGRDFPDGLLILADKRALVGVPEVDEWLAAAGYGFDTSLILARLLRRLELFKHERLDTEELAVALVSRWCGQDGATPDDLFQALNSIGSDRLRRRYWSWKRVSFEPGAEPGVRGPDLERDPRSAVAKFVVAHFAELDPANFRDLAEALVGASPVLRAGEGQQRPSTQITDDVLEAADIGFIRTGGRRYAVVRHQDDSAQGAEYLRAAFAEQAPLLRDRFVMALRRRLTIGHASDKVAQDYVRLEREICRETCATPDEAAAIVREALFGGTAGGETLAAALDDPSWLFSFFRGLPLAGTLLQGVADDMACTVGELLGRVAAVDQEGLRADQMALLRRASAWLSWHVYVEAGIPIEALPTLTRDGLQDVDAVREHRRELLATLRFLLFREQPKEGEAETASEPLGGTSEAVTQVEDENTVWRLLADGASLVSQLGRTADEAAPRLFALALANAGMLLRGRTWRAAADAMPKEAGAGIGLARATMSPVFAEWLDGAPGAVRDVAMSAEEMWRLCDMTLEVLIGKSGLGTFEDAVMYRWMESHGGEQLAFTSRAVWEADRSQARPDDVSNAVMTLVGRIKQAAILLGPLLALSIMDDDSFSSELSKWLFAKPNEPGEAPMIVRIRDAVVAAQALQNEWASFLTTLRIPWGESGNRQARDLLVERREHVVRLGRCLVAFAARAGY